MSVVKSKRGEGQLVAITKSNELATHTIRICSNEKVSHERRKLKKMVERAKSGYMTKEQVDDCFQSWKAHASYGDTYHLIVQMEQFYKNLWR